jgi:beta-glucosidase
MRKHHRTYRLLVAPVLILLLANCQTSPLPAGDEPAPLSVVSPADGTKTLALEEAMPPYKNPQLPTEERVEDLLSRMTLEEKIGQMTQVEKNSIRKEDITDLFIGSILSGGGGYPTPNDPEAWAGMVDGFQEFALKTRLGIPLIYGVDAVHGHGNVRGAVIFPHNIGLGATRDPHLVQRIGRATAEEMAATGIYWNFAPVVAVPQDIRWGRTYEGYSQNTELVSTLATAYMRGLQSIDGATDLGAPTTVLATPKHFVGDGGTTWGSSTATALGHQFMLDQGVTDADEATLRAVHLPPYQVAVDAGAKSIMVSFSSWNGLKMHAQNDLLTDVLKGELGFEGFLVSDWGAIDQIPGDYYSDVVTSINAGLDMVMVPFDYDAFIKNLTEAVKKGDVPMERVDDAVRRILTAKFELGLFESPYADPSLLPLIASDEHMDLANEAVRKSLVLFKNDDDTLPLTKDTPLIFVAGQGAQDIGMQCGGWTIEWQGKEGSITPGVTILEGIRNVVSEGAAVHYDRSGQFDQISDDNGNPAIAEVGIAVVGERPYTEGVGDRADLSLSDADIELIERVRARSQKLIIILISGRPMIITDQLGTADAFVAAWLPGSEGQGVADVLFGDFPFTGELPYTWPRSMDQIPFDFEAPGTGDDAPLFPFGYGLD